MANTFTWGGSNGGWALGTDWVGGTSPGGAASDVILFDGTSTSTSTIDSTGNNTSDLLIITDPNVTLGKSGGRTLSLTGNLGTSGLQMSGGTVTIGTGGRGQAFTMNTGTVSGGVLNLAASGAFNVLSGGSLTLAATGSINVSAGELNIGSIGSSAAGLIFVNNGGEALITGGSLTGQSFIANTGATFTQSAGGVNVSGLASLRPARIIYPAPRCSRPAPFSSVTPWLSMVARSNPTAAASRSPRPRSSRSAPAPRPPRSTAPTAALPTPARSSVRVSSKARSP